MATRSLSNVLGVSQSLAGRAWQWRGGNMDLGDGAGALDRDILSQLLMTRGVAEDEVDKHAHPTMREFLPDPSEFRDMDRAA